MLERRKEESEAMGKYQGLLISSIIAALIVFVAPALILSLTGKPIPTGKTAEDVLFEVPTKTDGTTPILPPDITGGIQDIWRLLIWFVRIVLIAMIMVSVIMLRIHPNQNRSL